MLEHMDVERCMVTLKFNFSQRIKRTIFELKLNPYETTPEIHASMHFLSERRFIFNRESDAAWSKSRNQFHKNAQKNGRSESS